ncbi:MAG: arginine deiminase family protein [Methanomicrobiales archaeon]|nr:arginine deiminase family protein [Methanomicrobiales archaeon]
MEPGARAEWDTLRHVLVHEPGIEVFFALLAPEAHLYERFFNHHEARWEHRQLCDLLHNSFGVRIHHLKTTLMEEAGEPGPIRDLLVSMAARRLGDERPSLTSPGRTGEAGRAGPAVPLDERDPEHLFRIIVLNPAPGHGRGGHVRLINPLHNLYFMRDQQAATDRGICMGRMATHERSEEVAVSALGLRALEVEPVHRVSEGKFEGGDFIPAREFALVGCGSRTNPEGVRDLLAGGIAFDEVGVVREPKHPLISGHDHMVNMHLDTYLNFPKEGVAVGSPVLLREAKVTVFNRSGKGYERSGDAGTLTDYLTGKGFDLIEITTLEQLCFSTNFLSVRNGSCITPDASALAPVMLRRLSEKAQADPGKYGRLLAQAEHDYQLLRTDAEFFPHKKGVYAHGLEMTPLPLTNATGGYGGAHCMTCVIAR